jgi:hypothetical protein
MEYLFMEYLFEEFPFKTVVETNTQFLKSRHE